MKNLLAVAGVVFCLTLAIPAFAHHPADGIVSDDIYEMIELNLEGTPHLDLEFDTMGSGNDMIGAITVTVPAGDDPDPDVLDEAGVLEIISEALVGDMAWAGATGDEMGKRQTSLRVDISEPDEEGMVTITIYENIGNSDSQQDELLRVLPEPEPTS